LVQRQKGTLLVFQVLNPSLATGEQEIEEMRAPEGGQRRRIAVGAAGEQGSVGCFYHLYCWETTQTALEIVFC
jgi:hypothetical protein